MWIFSLIFVFLAAIFSVVANLKGVSGKIRSLKFCFGYFYSLLIIAFTSYSAYLTFSQFFLWKNSELGRYLLPPHTTITYFVTYTFYRFWAHFLAALVFSLAILFLTIYFNKKRGGIHFYEEEPYYIAIAILAVGYPGWLVYFSLMLFIPLLWSLVFVVWKWLRGVFELGIRNKELGNFPRISYYYLWLGLALGAILINKWFATFNWWTKLII